MKKKKTGSQAGWVMALGVESDQRTRLGWLVKGGREEVELKAKR